MSCNRRLFLLVWLAVLVYLLYSALVKSGLTSASDGAALAPLSPFVAPSAPSGDARGAQGSAPAAAVPAAASGASALLPAFPGALAPAKVKSFGVAGQAAPLQAPKVPVIFGASGGVGAPFSAGGAASGSEAAPSPAPQLLPTRCVDRSSAGQLPYTSIRRHAPGQVCLKNVYLAQGRLRAHLPPSDAPGYAALRDYLAAEGLPSASFAGIDEVLDVLSAAPIPSVPYAGALLESQLDGVAWGSRDHLLAHSYIFLEASANILALQGLEAKADAAAGTPEATPAFYPAPLLCCGCGPHLGGVGGLNADIAKGLWGAELTRCMDVWGDPPGPRPPALLPGCNPSGGLLHGGSTDGAKPWALHIGTLCLTDRTPAFKSDGRVEKWKAFSAGLQPQLGPSERGVIEASLAHLRAYALGMLRERAASVQGLKDEFQEFIAQVVADGSPDAGPLITVLQRPDDSARTFPHVALASLHALFRPFTKRLLIIKMLPLEGWLRLAIAARTDLLVGTFGEDMGLLLFQPKGAAVLELAPHYTHFNVEGTGWSNALGFLSRLKGAVYSGADAVRGPIDPNGRVAEDLDYQMEMPVYVNNSALVGEVQRLLKEAKKNAEAAAKEAGGSSSSSKEWPAWHPGYVSEAVSFPAEKEKVKY